MSKVKIDKGIPIPRGKGKFSIYPWHAIEVSDSFLLNSVGASGLASLASKRYAPKKFICRKTPEGIRVWRIA
jgi:hypothetical protein